MIADRIRAMLAVHWMVLFGAILLAWLTLTAMAVPPDLREASQIFGAEFIEAFCQITPDAAGYTRMAAMWALMAAAMMLPTALPAFAAYDDLRGAGAEAPFAPLVLGFFSVWIGFALIAAALHMGLFRLDWVTRFGDSRSAGLSAGLLLLAGLYQFSTLKEACLSKCRAPLPVFIAHWSDGPWRIGLRMGAACLGCCWALMLLAFVGGMMSLVFMGLATAIMILEKLPQIGRYLSRPLGVGLIAASAWTALNGI